MKPWTKRLIASRKDANIGTALKYRSVPSLPFPSGENRKLPPFREGWGGITRAASHIVLTLLLILFTVTANAIEPTITPDASVMRLDEIGLYRVGYAYRGKTETLFPFGWSGFFEERTGIACLPLGAQKGRQAFLIHCPWRGGTGFTYQEFVFDLPKAKRILLKGATAIRSDVVGKSDGVTFRIFTNGRKRLDVHRADDDWNAYVFDLTPYAGKRLVLRFVADPGPKNDSSFDYGLWGDRELVFEGFAPKPKTHPAPPALVLARLHSRKNRSVVPISAFSSQTSLTRQGNAILFHYRGKDGRIDYRWEPPAAQNALAFGTIKVQARMKGDKPITTQVGAMAALEWTVPSAEVKPFTSHWQIQSNGPLAVLTHTIKARGKTVDLHIAGKLEGKSLMLDVWCDQPLLKSLEAGGWGPSLRRRIVPVPYYSGSVAYLPQENLFVNAFLDWTTSQASNHDGTRAIYGALTDGTRNLLRERIIYSPAWHFAEVLPNIPNPPSPYRKLLGNRVMLDIWGGRYTTIAEDLEKLADYGIDHAAVIIHDWQRSGYDNALPAHVPAASDKGGDPDMKKLVQTGTKLGNIMTLHENYVDYYPNYEGFDAKHIALDSEGKRVPAWYNPGTKMQSFAIQPNAILPLAQTQSPEVHRRYGTNGDYLDVHSAVPPWFHVDFRAGEQGAGTFDQVWNIHRELWEYERKTHKGPVFGEGNNHWYWSGLLDGVEAQFGAGWPVNAGMEAPLCVDFDLLKIHPLQFNHGMGYYERWWNKANWRALPPMRVLDQYRMQEVAYGHMGFLAGATCNVLPLAWLENHLLSPVTARSATIQPTEIRYEISGKWVDGTEAAKRQAWKRVRIRYANGLTITTNDENRPLTVGKTVLPRFGWFAEGAGVTAYTALRNGVVADYAETKDSVFANARPAADWNLSGVRRIHPTVQNFENVAPREIRFSYAWKVGEPLPADYDCFVHFGKAGFSDQPDQIKMQQDHVLPSPTSQWKPGTTVTDGPYTLRLPDNLEDGDYQWRIGLYAINAGRVAMEGVDDGSSRILLGTLKVRDNGSRLTFLPETRNGNEMQSQYGERLNTAGKVVDFGTVRTNGSIHVLREGKEWVLQTLPRDRDFVVELSTQKFGKPTQVRAIGSSTATLFPLSKGAFWRLPLNGAKEYRWFVE